MPLLWAIPLAVGGYALFAGAIANKPDPSSAPVTATPLSLGNILTYGGIAIAGYYVIKKLK